jgi:Mrp family chromosome partitioning ATPase
MQHKLFGVAGTKGLAELLKAWHQHGQSNGSAGMIQSVVQKIGPMRLGLIVAGVDLADAAGLLGSNTMNLLLEAVSRQADFVIIDSPPVLAVSDALMLSIQVDGVVLVASAGSITRKQLEQALRRLGDVHSKIVGVVLNRQKAGADDLYQRYASAYANPTGT